MPQFGARSHANLRTCHDDLQILFNEVVAIYDCAVICGNRPEEEQEAAFLAGRSKVQFPNSTHNKMPSHGADVVPWPVDWQDHRRFYIFGGFVLATAARLYSTRDIQHRIRWGGDWDGDLDLKDQNFHDLPHFELVGA